MKIFYLSFLIVSVAVSISCSSKKVREFSSRDAVESLKKNASQIQSIRGRVWISYESSDLGEYNGLKGSFPAVIAIDLKNPKKPRMRFEAIDLMGVTHALVIMDRSGNLTWLDYDQKKTFKMKNSWQGIPMEYFPQLIMGLAPIPEEGKVGLAIQDSFEITSDTQRFLYLMEWIDPGPRLAVSVLEGFFKNPKTKPPRQERLTVKYSKFKELSEFYLPEQLLIRGYSQENAKDPDVKIEVSWRERRFNEELKDQLFVVPKVKY